MTHVSVAAYNILRYVVVPLEVTLKNHSHISETSVSHLIPTCHRSLLLSASAAIRYINPSFKGQISEHNRQSLYSSASGNKL